MTYDRFIQDYEYVLKDIVTKHYIILINNNNKLNKLYADRQSELQYMFKK
jgi:hypothetical protein